MRLLVKAFVAEQIPSGAGRVASAAALVLWRGMAHVRPSSEVDATRDVPARTTRMPVLPVAAPSVTLPESDPWGVSAASGAVEAIPETTVADQVTEPSTVEAAAAVIE